MRWSEANRRREAAVDNVRGLRVWGVRAENGRINAGNDVYQVTFELAGRCIGFHRCIGLLVELFLKITWLY